MKFNKIFSVLASAALMVGTYACTDKVEPTPSPVAGNAEVYFPYDEAATIALPVDATMVSVSVNRLDASEEMTVALTSSVTYTDEDGKSVDVKDIFTIPSSVTFPQGVDQIALEIGVDFEKVVMDREYNIDLTLDEAVTGSYGLGHKVFVATYLPWTDWELYSETEPGTYTVALLASGYFTGPVYYRQSLSNENLCQYSMFLPYESLGISEEFAQMIFNVDASRTIEVNGVECPVAWMEGFCDYDYVYPENGESIYYTTTFTWLKYYYKGGGQYKSDDEIYGVMEANGIPVSYFNPVEGRLYLYMHLFSASAWYNELNDPTLETMQLPGEYSEYYFTFNYSGNFVDKTGKEYAYVEVIPSSDIDHFACEMVPGKLTGTAADEACDALAADADAEYIYGGTYTLAYAFEEAGDYTAIAVGFDKDNKVVCKGYKSYTFETVQSESAWIKLGGVDFTDGIFGGLFIKEEYIETWEVQIEESKETPGYYRLVNPYASWPLMDALVSEAGWGLLEGNFYIEIDAQDPECVLMPYSDLGVYVAMTYKGSPIGNTGVYSEGWLNVYQGATLEAVKKAGLGGVFTDDYIDFPIETLIIEGDEYAFRTNYEYKNEGYGAFFIDFTKMSSAPAKRVHPNTTGVMTNIQMKRLYDSQTVKGNKFSRKTGHELSNDEIRVLRVSKMRTQF